MEFSAKGASGHHCNCHSPLFRFFFHVSGVVLIIVQSVICPFHGQITEWTKQAFFLTSSPNLWLFLYNQILHWNLSGVL